MYKDDDMHRHELYDMPNAHAIHLCQNYIRNFIAILYYGFRNNFNILEVVKFNTPNLKSLCGLNASKLDRYEE